MLILDPVVTDDRWTSIAPESLCEKLSELLSDQAVFSKGVFEAAVLFADDAELQRLNRQFRDKDRPTNVLSFPGDAQIMCTGDEPVHTGDIALSFDTIGREADAQSKALLQHTSHMIIHGVLHLIGHDHESDDEAETMETLEIALLAELGYANPYEA